MAGRVSEQTQHILILTEPLTSVLGQCQANVIRLPFCYCQAKVEADPD